MASWRALALLSASAIAYAALAVAGDLRQSPRLLVAAIATLGASYLGIAASLLHGRLAPGDGRALLLGSVLFRLLLFPTVPSLSDDVYRYVWDGRVTLATGNPYRHAPTAPELLALRDASWHRINYPELPTIYPPVAQLLFAAGALAGSLGLWATKLLLLGAEAALVLLLSRLLEHRGVPRDRLLLYLLHPLAILEIAHAGHVEPLGVALLVAAALLAERGNGTWTASALAASILTKVFPLALVPAAARRLRLRSTALLLALVAVAYVPFAGAGPNLYRSLGEYGTRWRWFDSGFALVAGGVERLALGERATRLLRTLDHALYGSPGRDLLRALYAHAHDERIARAIVLLVFAAVAAETARRRLALPEAALVLATAFAFLTPALHPWYLLWLLPWLCLVPHRALLLFVTLVPLSYATFLWPAPAGGWREPVALKVACFAGPALLGLFDLRRARSS